MKDNLIIFAIGVLFGAVIATGAFYVYTVVINNTCNNTNNTQLNGGQPPEMPNTQDSDNNDQDNNNQQRRQMPGGMPNRNSMPNEIPTEEGTDSTQPEM